MIFIHYYLELKWYLNEEANKLYKGKDNQNFPLYSTKDMMLKYYNYIA